VDQQAEVQPSLVEEVAREFELQEVAPNQSPSPVAIQENASAEDPLMESLITELIERFRQTGKFARK
jgi:hypothetical protein